MDAVLPPEWLFTVSPDALEAITLVYVVEKSLSYNAVFLFESVWHTLRHLSLLTLWYARYVVGTPLND